MTISHEVHIDAPIERVWALTVDVEAWPAMTPTMTSVERLDAGPLQVGSRARIKQPGQSARVWTVTELVPNQRFAWQSNALGVCMTGTHQLERSGTGCRNVLGIELVGGLGRLMEGVLGRQLRKTIATENEGFRRVAESARH
jgi:uncharacterized membrane protein